MPDEMNQSEERGLCIDPARRDFIKVTAVSGLGVAAIKFVDVVPVVASEPALESGVLVEKLNVKLKINGKEHSLAVDTRTSLLDALREQLDMTGSKKGCDHGQCGACTVIVDGRRQLSCLMLAGMCDDHEITTIEGLADGDKLHPMQKAFVDHDGLQCGYCTPGQICSAVAMLQEAKRGEGSYATSDLRTTIANLKLSDDEIRERMSGNICRCGAYPNIVRAIQEVQTAAGKEKTA